MADETSLRSGAAQRASWTTAVASNDTPPQPASTGLSRRHSRRKHFTSKGKKRRSGARGAQTPLWGTDARQAPPQESRSSTVSDTGGTFVADTSEATSTSGRMSHAAVKNGKTHDANEPSPKAQISQGGGGSAASSVKREMPTPAHRTTSANDTLQEQHMEACALPSPECGVETCPWDRCSQPTFGSVAEPHGFATAGTHVASGLQSENNDGTDTLKGRRKSLVRFGATTIREITQRTRSAVAWHGGQQNVLIALVAVVVLLLSLAVLILLFVRVDDPLVLTRCSSKNCRSAARDLESFLDIGVDPCKDFYGHVCRRWEQVAKDDTNAATTNASDDFLGAHWRSMLMRLNTSLHETGAETDAHQGGNATSASGSLKAVARFYRFCHRFLLSPNVSLAAMLDSLDVDRATLQALLRQPDATSLLRATITLSLTRGVHVAFSLSVVHSVSYGETQLRVFQARMRKAE